MASTINQGTHAVIRWTVTSTEPGWNLADYTPSAILERSGKRHDLTLDSIVANVVSYVIPTSLSKTLLGSATVYLALSNIADPEMSIAASYIELEFVHFTSSL